MRLDAFGCKGTVEDVGRCRKDCCDVLGKWYRGPVLDWCGGTLMAGVQEFVEQVGFINAVAIGVVAGWMVLAGVKWRLDVVLERLEKKLVWETARREDLLRSLNRLRRSS